jgi:pyruvate kinase
VNPAPRLTKIVATIGPACDAPETLDEMIEAGMSVARLNLSHGTHEEHAGRIARIRESSQRCGVPIAVMLDTKGPEVRTAPGEPVTLTPGQPFVLAVDGRPTTPAGTSVTHRALPREVEVGTSILIAEGSIELVVVQVADDAVVGKIVRGGELGGRKSVHVRGARLSLDPLGPADEADLRFGVEQGVDWIAASFIRSPQDVERIRAFVHGAGGQIPIIAKIEDADGVANLLRVLEVSDGAMVARGDLGVSLPVAHVPLVQKRVIRMTIGLGKPVITATQMLDSMERNATPTRAEATDVANAIFDGTSAVMLSGETARGLHPVGAVRTMRELAERAESALGEYGDLQRMPPPAPRNVTEAVAGAAVAIARDIGAAAIVSLTESGEAARSVAKYRPSCRTLAVTPSQRVQRQLAISWGVTPLLHEHGDDATRVRVALDYLKRNGLARNNDRIVTTAGVAGARGSTNAIRVVSVE